MKLVDDAYKYGFAEPEKYVYKSKRGLSKRTVEEISRRKNEPSWMRDFRLKSLLVFKKRPLPTWGSDLSGLKFSNIYYYIKPTEKKAASWEELPEEIKRTYERIGIPEAEKKLLLGGVSAQYDSEVVYKNVQKSLSKKGVIFLDMDSGLREYSEIVKKYFGTIVPFVDNKFAALNSAVWSGGSFIYVPKNIKVELPLQAYFRINAANMGQFERTLIIADEGSYVHYVEGCSAPIYSKDSLHAAVVEIIIKKGARVRYTTIQNWSSNVYNLVTKRARVEEEGIIEWVSASLGSKITMLYPSSVLKGKGAKSDSLSLSFSGVDQEKDTGGKAFHLAPYTSSTIINKSVVGKGGKITFRGLVNIAKGAKGAKTKVKCDTLMLDKGSQSATFPHLKIEEPQVEASHEAVTGRIEEEKLFYLMSRGLKKEEAERLIVNGFIEPVVKELPLEYAVEMNRLIELEMKGAVG